MKLEDQVCSLELSTRLKELGVKQISLFYYCERMTGYHNETEIKLLLNKETTIDEISKYSAFTVAELGELLPKEVEVTISEDKDGLGILKANLWIGRCKSLEDDKYEFGIFYGNNHQTYDEREADARAKMIIHLIENKIISPNKED